MRELFLVSSESNETSLVLRSEDGEQFFLAIDDSVRETLTVPLPEPEQVPEPEPEPERVETPAPAERSLPSPDPRLTAPLSLRPREIQERIRAGGTIEELAREMGVMEARVEPFAHPVLLERARIAELAKQAHPVREDGPASLTLWETLAAAFAARGHTVTETRWDAYREPGGRWVLQVSWTAGLSDNTAEWNFQHHMTSGSTVEARNAVAADLTDPDFVQPVRTLTSVGQGSRYEEDLVEDVAEEDLPLAEEEADQDEVEGPEEIGGNDEEADADGERKPPAKRRRKAVTPHWEDVLLGVRTNTKRPRG